MQRRATAPDSLDWGEVRLFLALCRGRTVGHAAEALGVDASTVSRRLAALEEALDLTLFDRGRQGAIPTEAAEELLPVAEEMEAVMRRFASAAQGLEREVAGLVREAGFQAATTSRNAFATVSSDLFALERVQVAEQLDRLVFALEIERYAFKPKPRPGELQPV